MPKINDGGPAFSTTWDASHNAALQTEDGMSKRAYIATKIAAALATYSGSVGINFGPGSIATRSCEIADALIASLAEGGAE